MSNRPEETSTDRRAARMRELGFWGDTTISDYFGAAVAKSPERLAVVERRVASANRTALTYADLSDRVDRIASAFMRLGVGPGDVVSIQLPNWWQFIAVHLAAMKIGAVTNPLMPIFRSRELAFMLALAESKVLIAPEEYRGFSYGPMVQELRATIPTLQHAFFVDGTGADGFEALLQGAPAEDLARRVDADAICQILFTSGTTGEPKGVMHTSNTLWGDVRPRVARLGLTGDDVVYMPSPLAHQTGFLVGILMPVLLGTTSVLQDTWNGDRAVEIMRDEAVTFTMASTPFLLDLTEAVERSGTIIPSLRIFVAGGAPIPRSLVRRATRQLGASIVSIWGMTECGASTATDVDDPIEKSSETDGKPNPGAEIRVVDRDNGRVLPPRIEGNLQVRSSGNFVGYLKRPQLNSTNEDGWLDTGDLATIDEAGYVRITGRTKDVIIRGGENVPVVEIEGLLYEHPAIAEIAIVPYPDERLGERGCAFVVLRPNHTLNLAGLVEFLLARKCARNYLPERLEVLEQMPRTPSGKIQKFVLREAAREKAASVS